MVRSTQRFVDGKLLAVVACLLAGDPAGALAAEFHAILARFGNSPHPEAHLDVSFDTNGLAGGPVDVLFDVFGADGGVLTSFAVRANADGFASTASAPAPNDNLFDLSGGEPALVRARTPSGVGAKAILRQRESGNRLAVSVPPDRRSGGTPVHVGRHFTTNVGDVQGAASLLVANVSAGDIVADLFVGTPGATNAGKYTNPRIQPRCTWRLDLQPDDQNANLVLTATEDVVVQLVVDDGRVDMLTVLPTAP